jgi:hypothetical protein
MSSLLCICSYFFPCTSKAFFSIPHLSHVHSWVTLISPFLPLDSKLLKDEIMSYLFSSS